MDQAYFDAEIRPRLGSGARYVGHLDQRALCRLVGSSAVALVTPAWDEPFGLVAAEAMLCGTPVAGYRRGGLREVVTPETGRLATANEPGALAGGDRRRGYCSTAARCGVTRSHAHGVQTDGRRVRGPVRHDPLGASGVIGYYVHHVGAGHLHRARAVAQRTSSTVTGLSSLPRPGGLARTVGAAGPRRPVADARSTRQPADGSTGFPRATPVCGGGWRRCRRGSTPHTPTCSSVTCPWR